MSGLRCDNQIPSQELIELDICIENTKKLLASYISERYKWISEKNFITFPCCNMTYPIGDITFIEVYYYDYDTWLLDKFNAKCECVCCGTVHYLADSVLKLKYEFKERV
jgi:hypothetical protein